MNTVAERAACATCGAPGQEQYCPVCGQRRLAGRHTLGALGRSVLARLAGEKGLIHTAAQLTVRPGRTLERYLSGGTVRYLNPISYLLIAAALFTITGRAIGGATGAAESDRLWTLLVIPFVGLASRLLHWRGKYNLAEHLIIVTYLAAHVLVILTVLYPGLLVLPATAKSTYALAAVIVAAGFYLWGYTHAFDRRLLAAVTGVLSLALGSLVWLVILMAIMTLLRH